MDTNNSYDKQDDRMLSLAAFAFFLGGFIVPVICVALRLSEDLFVLGFISEVLALFLGVLSRRRRLGKIAAIGAGVYFVIAIGSVLIVIASVPRQ